MFPKKEINTKVSNRIYPILVDQIYTRSNIGIIATIVNASILVVVLWNQIRHWRLVIWISLVFLVSFIRFFLNKKFIKTSNKSAKIRTWGQLLIISLGIPGILWGSTAIFLFPLHSAVHQVFIAFVLAGMVAGAVGVFSPMMSVFLSFSIPALMPITVRFFIMGEPIHIAMGSMTTLFAALTFITAKRINNSNKELILLKETFADKLKIRTAELEEKNVQLIQEVEERRNAEKALADSEKRLSDIIEFLPDPTWVIDISGKVIAWNQAIEKLSGIEKKEIIGENDYIYAVPFYGKKRPVLIDFVLNRDSIFENDYITIKEEYGRMESESFHPLMGESGKYFAAAASILYNAQGLIVGAIESLRDITAAKQLEKNREDLIKELRKAIAKVRVLSGLLPICSQCKKIRDDKGYWNQIESYIRDHSEAEFSHSICPECAKILYPELDI
jgi:PAS domain-containing protein